ncbi:hypothetical protein C8Q77DRAFT_1152010 [Trametes polyzona]|nr:hypothetical protein C8Q77DRAFT_1152010 [Trametes polyzona]
MHTPADTSSWQSRNMPLDNHSLPSVDDRPGASRPSPVKRLIRRMGLSTTDGQGLSHLQDSSSARSSGSLAKSFASTSPPTLDGDRHSTRSTGLISRLLEGRASENELPDVAEWLEDDNLSWGKPVSKTSKTRRRRKDASPCPEGL